MTVVKLIISSIVTAAGVVTGGNGDDTLTGNGGADAMFGDAGDGVFELDGLDFSRLDGGDGMDTLLLTGAGQAFNLTQFRGDQIQSIEHIDLSALTGATLTLNNDILDALTGGMNALSGIEDSLVVSGDSDDTVDMGDGWTSTGTTTIDGESCSVYPNEQGGQVAVDEQVGFA